VPDAIPRTRFLEEVEKKRFLDRLPFAIRPVR
jgi:hypothetical protein